MMLPTVVIGGGGHARVVVDTLFELNRQVIGYVALECSTEATSMFGVPYLGNDEYLNTFDATQIELANGVGSVRTTKTRTGLYLRLNELGYQFTTLVHPSATVSRLATLNHGVQVMAGAVIQPGCVIGVNSIVNTSVSIDHDCVIGGHVHIAPGATLSGGVQVGDGTHIGTGATVIQGVTIGVGCLIGAGTLVVRDVPDGTFVVGVPGRERVQ
jgi:sugar O-acyltransferase (sialic acid O-acetyltransferase NeuD family)